MTLSLRLRSTWSTTACATTYNAAAAVRHNGERCGTKPPLYRWFLEPMHQTAIDASDREKYCFSDGRSRRQSSAFAVRQSNTMAGPCRTAAASKRGRSAEILRPPRMMDDRSPPGSSQPHAWRFTASASSFRWWDLSVTSPTQRPCCGGLHRLAFYVQSGRLHKTE